jgi:hypothetical protein
MTGISLLSMRQYLKKCIHSVNQNKIHGLLAEIDLRNHLTSLGYGDRISAGGWILRSTGPGNFSKRNIALFPEFISPDIDYPEGRPFSQPSPGLYSICSVLHSIEIDSYFCSPVIVKTNSHESLRWHAVQLGLPSEQSFRPIADCLNGFQKRSSGYNFLQHNADSEKIPDISVPDQFSKEHLRVTVADLVDFEISDIDGIFYGRSKVYPLEIKEKSAAYDKQMGPYFGLDIGPFAKLAFYSARMKNMHSVYIVREIDHKTTRRFVQWWVITYEDLASFASWVPWQGGQSMTGSSSTVVKIPKSAFSPLDKEHIALL